MMHNGDHKARKSLTFALVRAAEAQPLVTDFIVQQDTARVFQAAFVDVDLQVLPSLRKKPKKTEMRWARELPTHDLS